MEGRASNAPLSTAIISVHDVLGNFTAYSCNLRGLKHYGLWLIADCLSLKPTLIRFLRKYPFGMFFHCLGNRPAINLMGKLLARTCCTQADKESVTKTMQCWIHCNETSATESTQNPGSERSKTPRVNLNRVLT